MTRALVIEHAAEEGCGSLATWLPVAGMELDVVRPWLGERRPVGVGGWDALIVMGGFEAAYDDDPGLRAEEALLRAAVQAGLPTLAICLGHQLLATALGGRVQRAAVEEHGAGLVTLTPAAAADPVLGGLPAGVPLGVAQSHGDEVVELPAGAVLLATSVACAVQAFRVGSALGLQFHPEATPELVSGWAQATGGDAEAEVAGVVALDLQATWRPALERFAAHAAHAAHR